MKRHPEFSEWDDANNTLYREFYFKASHDIETLISLVKDNFQERGNEGYTRSKLVGILRSYESRLFRKWLFKKDYPKTWWIRIQYERCWKFLHRFFKTKKFKNNVYLCNLAHEVVKEMKNK